MPYSYIQTAITLLPTGRDSFFVPPQHGDHDGDDGDDGGDGNHDHNKDGDDDDNYNYDDGYNDDNDNTSYDPSHLYILILMIIDQHDNDDNHDDQHNNDDTHDDGVDDNAAFNDNPICLFLDCLFYKSTKQNLYITFYQHP